MSRITRRIRHIILSTTLALASVIMFQTFASAAQLTAGNTGEADIYAENGGSSSSGFELNTARQIRTPYHQSTPSPSATPTVALTPKPTSSPKPTATPTPSIYGVGGIPNPTLIAPVQNPVTYGADPAGVNDSTAAFQKAVDAGDMLIPSGTYKISGQITVPSNRNIQCAVANKTIIKNPNSTNGNVFLIPAGTGWVSVSNCDFEGTNTSQPPKYVAAYEWNYFVEIEYGAHDVEVENNYFRNCAGNACVHTYTNDTNPATTNITVRNDEFDNCGIYGVTTDGTTNSYIGYNIAVDCTIGPESEDALQPLNTGLIEQNHMTRKYGTGWENAGGVALSLTCGWSNGLNYSGMTCQDNVGAFGTPATHLPWMYGTTVVGHGTYINNQDFIVKN